MDVVEQVGSISAALTDRFRRTPQMGGRKIRHPSDVLTALSAAVFGTRARGVEVRFSFSIPHEAEESTYAVRKFATR